MMGFDLLEHAGDIYRFCRARCADPGQAQDMAQEVLLAAWAQRERLAGAEHPAAYLTGIAKRVCAGYYRRSYRQAAGCVPGGLDALPELPAPDDGQAAQDAEACARLRACVANLACEHRQLIVAHYFEGRSVRQIAEATGMPEGTVKWRLLRAREGIRKEWNGMDGQEIKAAIAPARLEIWLSGTGPAHDIVPELATPTRCLLIEALQAPMSVRAVAERVGIPAMLAEEEIRGLVSLQAVARREDGAYQASVFVQPLAYGRALTAAARALSARMQDKLAREMDALKEVLLGIGFSMGRAYEDARPTLLMHLVHDGFLLGPRIAAYDPPLRPDGARYYIMAAEYEQQPQGLTISDWYSGIPGLEYRSCTLGPISVRERLGTKEARVSALCQKVRAGRADEPVEFIAEMIAAGLLRRDGEALAVAVPWFTSAQFAQYRALAGRIADCVRGEIEEFCAQAGKLLDRFLPAHLRALKSLYEGLAVFDLMAAAMEGFWREDADAAMGLIFVEA